MAFNKKTHLRQNIDALKTHARFKRKVIPGDVLEMECELKQRRGPVGIGTCRATVNGEEACTAELSFAVVDEA